MTEHTRELSVEAHDEPEEFWFPGGYVSVRSGDDVIAILGGEEAHYANMFAAAPDLLAALERAVEALRNDTAEHAAAVLIREGIPAIARARGEG